MKALLTTMCGGRSGGVPTRQVRDPRRRPASQLLLTVRVYRCIWELCVEAAVMRAESGELGDAPRIT